MIHGRRASTDEKGRRRTSQHPKCMTLLTKMHMGTDLISEQWEKKKQHCKTCNAKINLKIRCISGPGFGEWNKEWRRSWIGRMTHQKEWLSSWNTAWRFPQSILTLFLTLTLSFSISFLGCEKEVATHFSTVGIYFGLVGPFKRKTHRGHGLPSPPKQKLHNGCHKITKKRSKSGGAGNFLPHLHPNSVRIFSVL